MSKTIIKFDVSESYTHYILGEGKRCPEEVLNFLDDVYSAYCKGRNFVWSLRDNLGTTAFMSCEVSGTKATCATLCLTHWAKANESTLTRGE